MSFRILTPRGDVVAYPSMWRARSLVSVARHDGGGPLPLRQMSGHEDFAYDALLAVCDAAMVLVRRGHLPSDWTAPVLRLDDSQPWVPRFRRSLIAAMDWMSHGGDSSDWIRLMALLTQWRGNHA